MRQNMEHVRHYVVFTRSYTGSQAFPPERHRTREDAESSAREWNRSNQDHSWNAVQAHPVGVQVNRDGHAI